MAVTVTMLDAARDAYDADGYWLAPVLFDGDEIERFRAAVARVINGEYRGARPPTLILPVARRIATRSSPNSVTGRRGRSQR